MIEKQYSGENSKAFWAVVNLVDDDKMTLYDLGCELQNLEEKVLGILYDRYYYIEKLKKSHNKRITKQASQVR